ncbi:MAG: T9SS type A sorting domain-containing protein [Candidatus Cloacimonetes bacterium]|nr:T9SS type A sorting domain-containing protein [Candidatus Cloacimonadota bacterium]
MKKSFLLLILLIPLTCDAYFWSAIGPQGIIVNDFYVKQIGQMYEIICAEDGLYIFAGDEWINYNYGYLPAVAATDHQETDFLVILADGSWSDGIYIFNLITHEHEIQEWCYYPNFILYCSSNSRYYVGYYYGLYESLNGTDWNDIPFFSGINCTAMAYRENHLVVAEMSNLARVYYSDDYGENWNTAAQAPFINDMIFHENDILYAIFPDTSNSSGIWKSENYGASWSSVLYCDGMTSINHDFDSNIFVGWGNSFSTRYEGVARWNPDTNQLFEMNEGLPDTEINHLTVHPVVDCVNIVACTGNGVYMLTDYQVSKGNEIVQYKTELYNNPNPFNPTTTIHFSLIGYPDGILEIFNLLGQKVKVIELNGNTGSVNWNGHDYNGRAVPSGVYLYRITTAKRNTQLRKMTLLK